MGLNTKCPIHGNAHPDSFCSLQKEAEKLTEILAIPDKKLRVRSLLEYMVGKDNVETWLNAPCPDLGNRTPQAAIDEGKVDAVVALLEDAMNGMPS